MPTANNLKEPTPGRMPVYFLSIGGPAFIEDKDHSAYAKLVEVGREITTRVKPKAIVSFSAHWSDSPNTISVNVAEKTDIIYDFHGFPPHYYEYKYPNEGSVETAEKVTGKLEDAGIEVKRVERGLDHGAWVGFLAAFDPATNPLGVPIVQVSLYATEDVDQHYRLGQALESLRDEGILIIGAGMATHNLPDFRQLMGTNKGMPYASTFPAAMTKAATVEPEERHAAMLDLMKRSDARKAHPTLEHLLPMYVVAGAAGEDVGIELWNYPEGSLNWAQYRFGSVF